MDNQSKLYFLKCLTEKFDLQTGTFKKRFEDACQQLSVIVECTYKFTENEQKALFENLRREQQKLFTIEDVKPAEVEHKEIYQKISELMIGEKVFGWEPNFFSESYIKYFTPTYICRKKNMTTSNIARSIQLAVIDVVENYIQHNTNKLKLPFDLEGIKKLLEFLENSDYDSRNFSYTDDWALAEYRKEQDFIKLTEMEKNIENIATYKIRKNMLFYKDNFKYNIKISQIKFSEMTLDECVDYIENSKSYNGFYNVDGVLMPKDKAILSIQKLFCKERYSFKLMISFGKNDVTHISYR